MELYKVPRGSYIRVISQDNNESPHNKGKSSEVRVPVDSLEIEKGELIYFSHTDGMYSLCYKVDEKTMEHGDICHMAVWTEVEIVDIYEGKDFEAIRSVIGRSGYGKDGLGEYRQAALKDMSDEWVKASIDFVNENHPHRAYYIKELEYRKEYGIVIED